MTRWTIVCMIFLILVQGSGGLAMDRMQKNEVVVDLPAVSPDENVLEDLLFKRESVRRFKAGSLSLEQVSKIMFAAQGVNRKSGRRTVPSAGALYPLEVFFVAGEMQSMEPGVYRYVPATHSLVRTVEGDRRSALARAALGQSFIAEGQGVLIICAVFERVTGKYGQRGIQYVHIEAGCAAQAVSLQAVSLGLGTTLVGAFRDDQVKEIIGSNPDERPLLILPIGYPR